VKVLAIGAHPDDIELGCAATLAMHQRAGDQIAMLVMTAGERGPREDRLRELEQEDACRVLGAELYWGGFADGQVPSGAEAISVIEEVINRVRPDVIYTHALNDTHQDHRATAQATMSAGRWAQRICGYESPTTTEFNPTIFVEVAAGMERKLEALRAHTSQVLKNGLVDLEAIEAMARYRGFQARVRHAEAFESARYVVRITPDHDASGSVVDLGAINTNQHINKGEEILA
jgi:LmbE family N-acetylglucosaminyl deacetylase